MLTLPHAIAGLSFGMTLMWVVAILAAAAGAIMVMLLMFEELPGIIRGTFTRSFKKRRS
jgi:hypothetical protein